MTYQWDSRHLCNEILESLSLGQQLSLIDCARQCNNTDRGKKSVLHKLSPIYNDKSSQYSGLLSPILKIRI